MSDINLNTLYLTLRDELGNTYEPEGLMPKDGKSIYEYALQGEYKGTEEEFMNTFFGGSDVTIDTYPVGSIYINGLDISPADLFGGDWEQLTDVFLLAASDIESDTPVYSVGLTGGEAEVTLSVAQMPAHKHTLNCSATSSNGTSKPGAHLRNSGAWLLTSETGGGQAHNNLPPYIRKNIWKRVA